MNNFDEDSKLIEGEKQNQKDEKIDKTGLNKCELYLVEFIEKIQDLLNPSKPVKD